MKNDLTYERWTELKQAQLRELDDATRQRRQGTYVEKPKKRYDGKNNNMILGCTETNEKVADDFDAYMRAFQKWRKRKLKLRQWQMKNNSYDYDDERHVTSKDLKEMRKVLYLDGFTYNEWLGQIDREQRHGSRARQRHRHKSVQFSDML